MENESTTNPTVSGFHPPAVPHPCPSCGHCPTCGRSDAVRTYPWLQPAPWYPRYTPIWGDAGAPHTTGGHTFTVGGSTTGAGSLQ